MRTQHDFLDGCGGPVPKQRRLRPPNHSTSHPLPHNGQGARQGHELALTGSGRPRWSGLRITTRTAAFRQANQLGDCPLPTQRSLSPFSG